MLFHWFYAIIIIDFLSNNVVLRRIKWSLQGIVRRVDELGRVVIPIELRNQFDISEKDPIEIYVDGSTIVLKKFVPNCIFVVLIRI